MTGRQRFADVNGKRMACIEAGRGDAIVFQHGNPTSSYLWRNVMPHCEGLGRLVACDLIGMGASDKLEASGPDRYTYAEHREYLFALWDQLALGDRIVFVVHDWERRRPTLTWPRQIPIDGEPAAVTRVVEQYSAWLAGSSVPKLFVNADPGSILVGRPREFCRTWPNQTEVTVRGSHFVQEDSPDEIGQAVADFVGRLRA